MPSSCPGLPLQCIMQEGIERQLTAAAVQASAHILLLLLALLLESYLRLQHRRRQAAGYLAFYWRTRSLLPLATRVTALGQVLLFCLPIVLYVQEGLHFGEPRRCTSSVCSRNIKLSYHKSSGKGKLRNRGSKAPGTILQSYFSKISVKGLSEVLLL